MVHECDLCENFSRCRDLGMCVLGEIALHHCQNAVCDRLIDTECDFCPHCGERQTETERDE